MTRARRSVAIFSLVALVALVAPACAPPARDPATSQAVLLVTIDTLRADRVGAGGDETARTPHFDRLARRGTQFAVALSPVPLTLPAHATIHSGRLPPEHGARDNGLFRVREDVPLLAEAFAEAGFRTAAFLAAYPLAARFGLARGFETYADSLGVRTGTSSFAERRADRVVDEALAWAARPSAGRPSFVWVHLFDPHAPYEAPPPWGRALRDAYRGEVAYTDRQLGRLLRGFAARFDPLQVCCTADHGESLGEHGEETHGIFVYESTTRVPLALAGGGTAPAIDARPIPLTALPAMLLERAGIDDRGRFAGAPLREGWLYTESLYPELRHGWAALRSLRTSRWKVIRAPQPEVYDLLEDPAETANRWGDPAVRTGIAELAAALEDPRWAGTRPEGAPDAEVEEALASLGYAAAQTPSDRGASALPDPKERIRIEHWLSEAGFALEAGALPRARQAVIAALSRDPGNKEANLLRARLEAASGATALAWELFDRCLELPPASLDSQVWYDRGRVLLDLGRPEAADSAFARAVALDSLSVDARFNWGLAAYRRERWAEAVERWRGALALDPHHPPACQWLPDAEAKLKAGG